MIIKKLHIENFGKLQNLDIQFNDHLNQLYKENGWGKSTLSTFIKSMFYSMPAKSRGDAFNYERSKNLPWQGGKYGGYIEYETVEGNFRVTRYFDKTPEGDYFELKDLNTNKIITNENEKLGELLFGLGRDSFEVTAYFPQLKFASTTNAQITASLSGVDKFNNDLESVNQAVKKIDAKLSILKKDKPKKDDIELINKKINENNNLIDDKNYKITSLKEQIEKEKTLQNELLIELENEKEKLELKSKTFNNKLKLQNTLAEESNKLNNLLIKSNQLKDEKLKQLNVIEDNTKTKKKFNLPLLLIPFILVCLTLVLLTTFKIFDLVLGVSLAMGTIVIFSLICILVYFKNKKQNEIVSQNPSNDIENELSQIKEEMKYSQKVIESLNEQLSNYDDVVNPERDKIDILESKLSDIKLNLLKFDNAIKLINEEVDRLIEINDKLQIDCQILKDKTLENDKKIKILSDTKKYLLLAKDNVSARFIVPVNNKFKNVFSKFSISNKEFVIDTEWNVKENTNFGTKDFEYSSQGLQDIISFCQRICLIGEVYKQEKPLIILDDTFVNLDDEKLLIAKELVKEISKEYQILYICCNKRCEIT